jgi:restriction system protein
MKRSTHPDAVTTTFETLLEAVESQVSNLNQTGSAAFQKREYQKAKDLADQAEKLTAFRNKVLSLSSDWESLKGTVVSAQAEPSDKSERKFLGKLRKGMRTPETLFYRPILEVLTDVGGGGEMNTVLAKLYPKLADSLKPVDLEPLPSGPKTNLRWRNTAQWARNTLKEQGYLKSDSPHGLWEITDAGRKWLEKAKAQGGPIPL